MLTFDVLDVWKIYKSIGLHEVVDRSWELGLVDGLGFLFFLAQHWYLTSHYLKVAFLLRFTFSVQLAKERLNLQAGKRVILVAAVTVYMTLVVTLVCCFLLNNR